MDFQPKIKPHPFSKTVLLDRRDNSSPRKVNPLCAFFLTMMLVNTASILAAGEPVATPGHGESASGDGGTPVEKAIAPLDIQQIISRLQKLADGKILKQTYVYPADDINHVVVEEAYIDPIIGKLKWLRKTVIGSSDRLRYEPSALNVQADAGLVIGPGVTFSILPSRGKWSSEFPRRSLLDCTTIIERTFLESSAPFAELLTQYSQLYTKYQALHNIDGATDVLNKSMAFKHPGSTYTFQVPGLDQTRQDYSFYPNGIVREMKLGPKDGTVAILTHEFVDSADFSIAESEMQLPIAMQNAIYTLLHSDKPKDKPIGKTFGLLYTVINEGLLVDNVYANSPAFEAGLKPGDIIVALDEQTVSLLPLADIKRLLANDSSKLAVKKTSGETNTLTLNRINLTDLVDGFGNYNLAFPDK